MSRYYDPVVGRFISADKMIPANGESVQGYNLFVYCFNNPVNMEDETGNWPSWSDVKEWAKKKIKKIGEALEKSFVIEGGVGAGLDVKLSSSLVELEIGAYQDGYTFGYAEGKWYTSVAVSAGGTAKLAGLGFDGNYEIEHRHETDGKWLRDGHDAFSNPVDLLNCSSSKKSTPQGFCADYFGVSDSKNDVFIGYSKSSHVILGGHFKIGFNLTKFLEVLRDE